MKKLLTGSMIALSLITNIQAETSEVKTTVNKECINMKITQSINFGSDINPLKFPGDIVIILKI